MAKSAVAEAKKKVNCQYLNDDNAKTDKIYEARYSEQLGDKTYENAADFFRDYQGQKVAVLCARYQYRGRLTRVTHDAIVLSDPVAVEVSGSAMNETASQEDPIHNSIIVKTDAIEIFYQPQWVFAPLPNEENYDKYRESLNRNNR